MNKKCNISRAELMKSSRVSSQIEGYKKPSSKIINEAREIIKKLQKDNGQV